MMCQKCGKNTASVHLKQSINGIVYEEYLCAKCADNTNTFFSAGADFGNDSLFGALFSGGRQNGSGNRLTCPLCGSTSRDIQRNGKAGCAKCYEVFRTELKNAAYRIHGGAQHVGRAPGTDREEMELQAKLDELRERQHQAIEVQDFELAAKLRDEIKSLTDSGKGVN